MSYKKETMSNRDLRNFGLITGAVFILIFGLIPWLISRSLHTWPFYVAGLLWFFALLFPGFLRPVYDLWMKFGHVMGFINTRIILGVMFYVVIAPIGIIMKLSGKDPMKRTIDATAETYRIESDKKDKNHVERIF